MSTARHALHGVAYALVDLKAGAVLEVIDGDRSDERTDGVASASGELLRSGPTPDWSRIFARLGSLEMNDAFREVILVSANHVHIVERLPGRPDLALVAVSRGKGNLGEVLSGIHDRMARLKAA